MIQRWKFHSNPSRNGEVTAVKPFQSSYDPSLEPHGLIEHPLGFRIALSSTTKAASETFLFLDILASARLVNTSIVASCFVKFWWKTTEPNWWMHANVKMKFLSFRSFLHLLLQFSCCKPSHNRNHDPSWETTSPHLASVTKTPHDQRNVGPFRDALGQRPSEAEHPIQKPQTSIARRKMKTPKVPSTYKKYS